MYFPGEFNASKEESRRHKGDECSSNDNHKENPDPFLYTDSKIMTG